MKRLFREYDSKPFLYNVNTPNFQSFVTKLPEEAIKKIKFDSFDFFRQVIHAADLNLKMEEAMTDEELLQIIDFRRRRDYSLQNMNEKIAAGQENLFLMGKNAVHRMAAGRLSGTR